MLWVRGVAGETTPHAATPLPFNQIPLNPSQMHLRSRPVSHPITEQLFYILSEVALLQERPALVARINHLRQALNALFKLIVQCRRVARDY